MAKKSSVKSTSKKSTPRTSPRTSPRKSAPKPAQMPARTPAKPAAKPSDRKTGVARRTTKTQTAEKRNHAFVIAAARLMAELHCENVVVLDVRNKSQITDYILIASGTSEVQIRAVAQQVVTLAKETGLTVFGRALEGAAAWVALDLVEAVVHIFSPQQRAHYDLEMMWGDAPRIRWQRPVGKKAAE